MSVCVLKDGLSDADPSKLLQRLKKKKWSPIKSVPAVAASNAEDRLTMDNL